MNALETWHRLVHSSDATGLWELLAEDAVFHSPIVHAPQRGRPLKAINLIHQRMAQMLEASR